jgi:hypothetical protein
MRGEDLPLARHEASNFLSEYTDAVDRRDFCALATLVGDAVVIIEPAGMIVHGGVRVAALYRRMLPALPDGHHIVSNIRITSDGDRIVAASRYHFISGLQLRPRVLGRYRTEFVRRGSRLVLLRHAIAREFEFAPDAVIGAPPKDSTRSATDT